MQNLLNYSLQLTFYLYGGLALLLSLKCFLSSSKYASIFFISFIVSTVIGIYFKSLFYNDKFKEKSVTITIFFSWLLLILVSAIPFFSFVDTFSISNIFFISTSLITTTGFHHKLLDILNNSDAFNIWCSIIQLIGGFFSVLSYILFFLVFFNKHNKIVIFNKTLVLKFIAYYFFIFFLFIILLSISLKDIFNAFMIATAIISTGGHVGSFGPLLGFYYSSNIYLIIYSFLLLVSIFLLPFFLFIQNRRVLESFYIKSVKRSFLILIAFLIIFFIFFRINFLSFSENLFIYLSYITTTGILPNKLNNILILQKIYPLFFIFLFLIMVGSFSGSSGGGLKIDRISIIFIKVKDELKKLILNHKVYGIELIKKGFYQKELISLYSLISLGSLFIIGTVLSMTLTGYPVFDSFVVSLAALTNSGEGFLFINGIELKKNSFIYLILNFLMIFGRFEVIGYLLIFQKFSIRN